MMKTSSPGLGASAGVPAGYADGAVLMRGHALAQADELTSISTAFHHRSSPHGHARRFFHVGRDDQLRHSWLGDRIGAAIAERQDPDG